MRTIAKRLKRELTHRGPVQGKLTWLRRAYRYLNRLRNKWWHRGPYRLESALRLAQESSGSAQNETDRSVPQVLKSEDGAEYLLRDFLPGASLSELTTREPDRYLLSVNNMSVIGNDGVIYNPQSRTAFRETVEDWYVPSDFHPVLSRCNLVPPQHLSGLSFSLASHGASNYYHFLLEALPKLLFAKEWWQQIDHLLVNKPLYERQIEWIFALPLKAEIHLLDYHSHFECERLLFCPRVVQHTEPNPWLVSVMQNTFLSSELSAKQSRILFASRSSSKARNFIGEDDIIQAIQSAETVCFDQLTPEQVIETCQSAGAFIGFHGAAFSNTVFCQSGTKIIELYNQDHYPYYSRLSRYSGLEHHQIDIVNRNPGDIAGEIKNLL